MTITKSIIEYPGLDAANEQKNSALTEIKAKEHALESQSTVEDNSYNFISKLQALLDHNSAKEKQSLETEARNESLETELWGAHDEFHILHQQQAILTLIRIKPFRRTNLTTNSESSVKKTRSYFEK